MWLVGATAEIRPRREGVNAKPCRNSQRISRSKLIPSLRLTKQVKSLHRATSVTRMPVCRTPTHNLPPQTLTYGKWQLFQFKADRQRISDGFLFDIS